MKKLLLRHILLFIYCLFSIIAISANTNNKKQKIYIFEIKDEIAAPAWRKTQKAFLEAAKIKADAIVIHMNTYGGQVDLADSIRTTILNSKIKTLVFIDNNAASAGALISIACDSIYMRSGANIGAATVVNQTGEAMPDKYQSYMRSMMRSTAEKQGRNPNIAQAMVDQSIEIKGIIDSGKVLTFTTSEAIKHNFCDGQAESISEVLYLAGIRDYEIITQKLTATDKIINFLIKPFISGLLIMIIIAGIYFEMQSPGIGFPLIAAIGAALLYFAPLYLEGLAQNWEILLFIGGLVLLAFEIFVIPGFGIAGISGIIFIITGLTLSMVNNIGFSFDANSLNATVNSLLIVIGSIFFSIFGSFYLTKKLLSPTNFIGNKIILSATENKEEGYTSMQNSLINMIGKKGIAYTILRPSGKIIVDEEIYDATCENSYIDKNENIIITRYENMQLFVIKTNNNE